MKTHLRPAPHISSPWKLAIEIWHGAEFVGTIYGLEEGPGIKIVSKHAKQVVHVDPLVTEVRLDVVTE